MYPELWRTWSFPIPVVAVMLGVTGAYFLLRRGTGARPLTALAFIGGMAAVALALFSPIDPIGECCKLSMHMVQHGLLLLLGPALLLWGLQGVVPPAGGGVGRALSWLTQPRVALTLLLANLYGWHIPAAYQAALVVKPVHDLEHLLYLATGLVYWWAIIDPAAFADRPALSFGRKLAYLVVGSAAMMPLGLIIMWAPRPLYPHYIAAARAAGQSAIYDQQFAALVMLGSGAMLMVAALLAGLQVLGGHVPAAGLASKVEQP